MAEATAAAVDKRREIVRAAAELFDLQGYANTSMIEIANACGLQKPTLYHYFPRKDAILFEIHDGLMDHLQRRLDARRVEPGTRALTVLEGTINDLLTTFVDHPGFVRAFVEAHRELPDDLRGAVAEKRDNYADEIEALVEAAQADGDIRALDPRLTRLSVLGMANWAYHWLHAGGLWDADEVAEFMWDLVLHGLSPRR